MSLVALRDKVTKCGTATHEKRTCLHELKRTVYMWELSYNCCCWLAVRIVVVVLCVLLSSYVYLLYCVCIAVFLL